MVLTDIITASVSVGTLAISIVTLRILVVTLKETIDLNRKQLELMTIELNKAAREIRPEFSLHKSCNETTCWMSVLCEKNIAFKVSSAINFDASMDDKGNLIYQHHHYEPFYKPGTEVWSTKFSKDEDFPNGHLKIEFMDEDGRKYQQRLFFNVEAETYNDRPILL